MKHLWLRVSCVMFVAGVAPVAQAQIGSGWISDSYSRMMSSFWSMYAVMSVNTFGMKTRSPRCGAASVDDSVS